MAYHLLPRLFRDSRCPMYNCREVQSQSKQQIRLQLRTMTQLRTVTLPTDMPTDYVMSLQLQLLRFPHFHIRYRKILEIQHLVVAGRKHQLIKILTNLHANLNAHFHQSRRRNCLIKLIHQFQQTKQNEALVSHQLWKLELIL